MCVNIIVEFKVLRSGNLDSLVWRCHYLPSSGTASEVAGIVSATMFRKTVSDSKIVTPESRQQKITSAY